MYLDSLSTIYIKYVLVIKNKKTVELTEITLQQQHQKLLRLEAVLFCYFNSSFTAFKTLTLSSCSTIYNALNRTKTVCLYKVQGLTTTSKIIINKKIINKTFKALSRFYRSQKSHAAF